MSLLASNTVPPQAAFKYFLDSTAEKKQKLQKDHLDIYFLALNTAITLSRFHSQANLWHGQGEVGWQVCSQIYPAVKDSDVFLKASFLETHVAQLMHHQDEETEVQRGQEISWDATGKASCPRNSLWG